MSTRIWKGDAVDVADVWTLAVGGTWLATEMITLTINGKDIVITVGATVTTAAVATAIKEAWNGDDITGDATRNTTGNLIPEFAEATATVDSSTVTITATTAGVPLVITKDTDSSSGTLTLNNVTPATGAKYWSNADNWSGGAVPVDSDDVIFEKSDRDCLYGLDQSAIQPTTLKIRQSYTGNLGLPRYNVDGSSVYFEYRETYLKIGPTSILIGEGEGEGSRRIKIDTGTDQTDLRVINSGTGEDSDAPAILWKGSHASNAVRVLKGEVGCAFYGGESATIDTLQVGHRGNVQGDAVVTCGPGCTLTTIAKSGGELTIHSAATTITQTDGELWIEGAGAVTTLTVDEGAVRYNSSGTITTLNVGDGGTIDFSGDGRAKTATTTTLQSGATLTDSLAVVTYTNGIILDRCRIQDVTLDLGHNRTLTPS